MGSYAVAGLQAVLAGIALGMSMLPEEFPVVLTVFMAMGAWRISRARVLTRRASAIEALGSATVLCTDKTGTLTENRMSLAEFRSLDGSVLALQDIGGEMDDRWRELLTFGILASAQTAFDPMEKAFHELGQRELAKETLNKLSGYELAHSYGLRPAFLAMTQIWRVEGKGSAYIVAAKGAPEAIAKLCRLREAERAALTAAQEAMAGDGLRILAIARGTFSGEHFPAAQQEIPFEFLGLAGLADPLRSGVPNAVRECRSAGIKVIMITGDYKATARAIALQAGIAADDVLSGEDLSRMTEQDLTARVRTATVFARVMPEQKLGIVTALKFNNQVVAMTGDGVNDAPSLKAAHIGIAMGGRGTDVAREASSIVLLDDDFDSIVGAIRLGRRIYDNLRKAMGFIFAVHVPIAGLALLPLITGLPIVLGPMHIAFLEMVIDPVCSLVFEAEVEEPNVMCRPPRSPDEPLFSRALIIWSLIQGVLALGLVALIFMTAWQRGAPEAEVRALTFFSLVFVIVGLIFVNRSFSSSLRTAVARPNATLGWVLLTVVGALGATLSWPFARELFRFGPLQLHDILLAVAAGGLVLVILELLKSVWRKRSGGQSGLWRPL
jgi:Ca2+-transporting ATPase